MPQDDLLGHLARAGDWRPSVADTAEAIFTERFWYMGTVVPQGGLVFGAGLGYYPNRGVMDGYAGVTVEGIQHAFRASRHLGSTPHATQVGALRITVQEPMRRHRIELLPNDSGIMMDLEFRATLEPNDEGHDVLEKHGRVVADITRFVQFGHYEGEIVVRGQRHVVQEQRCWGARDRSWGLRMESRTDESHPPVTRFRPIFFAWVCAQFEDHGVHFFLKETAPGQLRFFVGDETGPLGSGRPRRKIVSVEHALEWHDDPYSQHIQGGVFTLHYEDGASRQIRLRSLPERFYLKAGMYGGVEGWFQGDDRGPLAVAHDTWDHRDPATRRKLRTLAEQVMQFDDGASIGYGTIQSGLAPGYPGYPEIQHLPTM